MDGLNVLLTGRPEGQPVTLTEIRQRTPRRASNYRVAEVLSELELLANDTTPAIRAWIDRRAGAPPAGFATLDDLDLPNRRITIAGHRQRLGELPHGALLAWLEYRRATWPLTANQHVLICHSAPRGEPARSATSISSGTCCCAVCTSNTSAPTGCCTRR
jgi:hypothetical protein